MGDEAGTAITTGDGTHAAVGYQALEASTTASNNTAMGYNAGTEITTGTENTVVGALAGDAITTGKELLIQQSAKTALSCRYKGPSYSCSNRSGKH